MKLANDLSEVQLASGANGERPGPVILGVQLAARTLAHRANNDLAVVVSCLGLLKDGSELGVEARELVELATEALLRVAATVRDLQHVKCIVTTQTPVGPAIDLTRSIDRQLP